MHIYRGLIGHMIWNDDQATYLLKLEGLYKRKPKTIFDSSLVFQGHSFLIFKNGFGNCLGCMQQLDGGNHSTHQTPLQSVHLRAQMLMTLYGPITWGSFCDKPLWWKITKPAPVTELEWILSKLVHIDISKDSPQFNYYGLDWNALDMCINELGSGTCNQDITGAISNPAVMQSPLMAPMMGFLHCSICATGSLSSFLTLPLKTAAQSQQTAAPYLLNIRFDSQHLLPWHW